MLIESFVWPCFCCCCRGSLLKVSITNNLKTVYFSRKYNERGKSTDVVDVNNVLLYTRSAIITSLTDCKPEVTERISLRRGIKDEKG